MAEKSAGHRAAPLPHCDAVDVLCGWLHDELEGPTNVYHQGPAEPCSAATLAHRFDVSVRGCAVAGLLMLRNVRERAIGSSSTLTIVQIEADGPVQSRGDVARRKFVIHVREQR